ncbi:unnamed protein product [Mytilus edulis]|uniref:Uncharacterized protein n=1 Tax=Mytilus edulis TaxID=6550 RepID=A0A8S3RTZ7_MYTED|nr:unnamed protein product [Mytilus edulis]
MNKQTYQAPLAVIEIVKVAKNAGIREDEAKKINATLIRHFISTEMATKDLPENERQYFYTHLGHSEEMNKQTYQAPLAVIEIVKVGKHLKDIHNELVREVHVDQVTDVTDANEQTEEELVREVHVDQVTDVTDANEQTEEGTRTTYATSSTTLFTTNCKMVDSVDISSHASTATLHSATFKSDLPF